jgi:hypothetical protein
MRFAGRGGCADGALDHAGSKCARERLHNQAGCGVLDDTIGAVTTIPASSLGGIACWLKVITPSQPAKLHGFVSGT